MDGAVGASLRGQLFPAELAGLSRSTAGCLLGPGADQETVA
ncbi:MAG TPA: hypothetical protein VHZ06_03380 [Marmoricola sp.]|nr:hypothetical protein [Marmoricola sp.]